MAEKTYVTGKDGSKKEKWELEEEDYKKCAEYVKENASEENPISFIELSDAMGFKVAGVIKDKIVIAGLRYLKADLENYFKKNVGVRIKNEATVTKLGAVNIKKKILENLGIDLQVNEKFKVEKSGKGDSLKITLTKI